MDTTVNPTAAENMNFAPADAESLTVDPVTGEVLAAPATPATPKDEIKRWTWKGFKEAFGGIRHKRFVNKTTGEQFESLYFHKPDMSLGFLSLSKKLGNLTLDQLKDRVDGLAIMKSDQTKNYIIYEPAELEGSEEIDF